MYTFKKLLLNLNNDLQNPLIAPAITPRFGACLTPEVMKGLAELFKTYRVPVQVF